MGQKRSKTDFVHCFVPGSRQTACILHCSNLGWEQLPQQASLLLFCGIREVNQNDSDFWMYTVKKVTNMRLHCFLAGLWNNTWSAFSIYTAQCIPPWNSDQQENAIAKGDQKFTGSRTSELFFISLVVKCGENTFYFGAKQVPRSKVKIHILPESRVN